MSNFFRKAILIVLVACLISCGTACKSDQKQNVPPNTVKYDSRENHYALVTESADKFFMQNAKTDYAIVLPENASSALRYAAAEFNTFLKKASKTQLAVITDSGLTYNETAKYISLGKTSLFSEAKINYDEKALKNQGYVIKTKDNSIFIAGPSDNSVLYGVYDLLNLFIDYKSYGDKNCYTESNVGNIPFLNIDVKENPDFDYRVPGTGLVINSAETANRMRMQSTRLDIPINGALGHTSMFYVPKKKYLNEKDKSNYHEDWYMNTENPTQLCYTARGNEESLNKMVEAALYELKESIKDSPNAFANFSLSDGYEWCTCDGCKAEEKKYGTITASVIKFLNKLEERVYSWFETEEGAPYKRDLYIYFYAYQQLEAAPVTYDEKTDAYSVISKEVRCNPHVVPQLCLTVANYTQTLDSEKNAYAMNNIKAWSACAEFTMSYMYSMCYKDYLIPYDTFSAVADWYQKFYENKCIYAYTHNQHTETGTPTGWASLKAYIEAELSWDCHQSVNDLISDYFDKTFRGASPTIKAIFNEYRALSEYNEKYESGYVTGVINQGNFLLAKYWPKNLLEKWRGDMEKAFSEIENLKTKDVDAYDIAYRHLRAERVWINYLYYGLYGSNIGDEVNEVKSILLSDLNYCGNICKNENPGSISGLLKELKS